MNKLHQVMLTLNSFSMGLILPILNLILLEKGSNLRTLPLLLAIYAIIVLCFELPSGICADVYGRKAVFLLSCVLYLVSFSLLIAANNMIWLVAAIIFFGLGRAFSSGSLDALIIDQALEQDGEGCLAKVNARMAVLEGVGLATGGILGGIIADTAGTFLLNIILRIVFIVIIFILCLAFIKEQPAHPMEQRISLIEHIRKGKQVVCSSPKFGFMIPGIFLVGFFLCTIETYWQPAFMDMPTAQSNAWVLGFITFLGFMGSTVGNITAQKLMDKQRNREWAFYKILRIIFAVCILIFALQKSIPGFMAWYTGLYMLLGAGNIAETTLINKLTPNHMRASVLSLSSLMTQIGVLSASVFSSIVIQRLQFAGIWMVAGGLLGGYLLVVAIVTLKREKEMDVRFNQSIHTE